MGISISNATSSAITKYSESLRSGEPDWSMIPSAGKSNKSQAEFVSEIKELAQRAANTTSKTELESIHRQRTRLCAEYISDVSPDRKALYQQAKNAVKVKMVIRNAKESENYHCSIFWRGQRGKITTLRKEVCSGGRRHTGMSDSDRRRIWCRHFLSRNKSVDLSGR